MEQKVLGAMFLSVLYSVTVAAVCIKSNKLTGMHALLLTKKALENMRITILERQTLISNLNMPSLSP